MNDGTGNGTMMLGRSADIGFREPLPHGLYVPRHRFESLGVLAPTWTGGSLLKQFFTVERVAEWHRVMVQRSGYRYEGWGGGRTPYWNNPPSGTHQEVSATTLRVRSRLLPAAGGRGGWNG